MKLGVAPPNLQLLQRSTLLKPLPDIMAAEVSSAGNRMVMNDNLVGGLMLKVLLILFILC